MSASFDQQGVPTDLKPKEPLHVGSFNWDKEGGFANIRQLNGGAVLTLTAVPLPPRIHGRVSRKPKLATSQNAHITVITVTTMNVRLMPT